MLRPETAAESAFRAEVREWLAAHVPAHLRHDTFRPLPEEGMPWYRALSQRGWIAPHWPKKHGGMGATLNEQIIMTEEFERWGCTRTFQRCGGWPAARSASSKPAPGRLRPHLRCSGWPKPLPRCSPGADFERKPCCARVRASR